MKHAEKRSLERFKLQLLSRISVRGKERDMQAIKLLTKDVSAGGAFFNISDPLSVGTRVDLDLILNIDRFKELKGNSALFNLSGTVIRTDKNGMAISFDEKFTVSQI